MNSSITLAVFNASNPVNWNFGAVVKLEYSTKSLLENRRKILDTQDDYILFWNGKNELPKQELLEKVISSKGNCWHIGSAAGLKTYPKLLDSVQPTNMLHLNCNETLNHSSWKLSFQTLLIEKNIFENTQINPYSNSLDIIGLDFGYNALRSGALVRFSNILSSNIKNIITPKLSKNDEVLFIRNNFDTKAFIWSYITNFFSISPIQFLKGFSLKNKIKNQQINYNLNINLSDKDTSTSIVVATLGRYKVLYDMLKELELLSLKPREIIIVDQTPIEKRNKQFLKEFSTLPIIYLEVDKIGQCSSRNLGIKKATSKFIWFLDDDMKEIPNDYLEKHLKTIYALNADVSCGIPDEVATTYIDRKKEQIRLSDGFPTNDVLVKRDFLLKVDGFDEKMDQMQSEDQEIGLRLIKEGVLSIKNNQLRILHLRASRGGLREHNVRKITFSSSRENIFQRRLMHYSEIYLNLKHYSKSKVYNKLLLNIRGTFIIRGNFLKKILKIIFAFIVLPDTLYKTYKNVNLAKQLLLNK